eukprot:TRINITY_DN66866_c4_g1_i1.p1 TRINITY_DN66866_c4_g1~~TRINITY_DN66866_c4_g1_i1.p1  ORF type:complete len:817 (+),score=112.44 TRINITY_DN66866_c4_g1_i1:70-2520(+)
MEGTPQAPIPGYNNYDATNQFYGNNYAPTGPASPPAGSLWLQQYNQALQDTQRATQQDYHRALKEQWNSRMSPYGDKHTPPSQKKPRGKMTPIQHADPMTQQAPPLVSPPFDTSVPPGVVQPTPQQPQDYAGPYGGIQQSVPPSTTQSVSMDLPPGVDAENTWSTPPAQRNHANNVHGSANKSSGSPPPTTNYQMISDVENEHCVPITTRDLVGVLTIAAPPTIVSNVKLETNHIDLQWLRQLRREGGHFDGFLDKKLKLNLDNFHEKALAHNPDIPHDYPLLDSPRSIILCLKNGIPPAKLLFKPLGKYKQEGSLEGIPDYVATERFKNNEARRKQRLHNLREQYRFVQSRWTQEQLIDWFSDACSLQAQGRSQHIPPWDDNPNGYSSSDGGTEGRSNQTQLEKLEKSKKKIEKITRTNVAVRERYIALLQERAIQQTEKAAKFDKKYAARQEEKRKAVAMRARLAAERAEERKAWVTKQNKVREEKLQTSLAERQEKEIARLEIIEDKKKQKQKEMEDTYKKLKKRMEQSKERQIEHLEKKREEFLDRERSKEEKAARRAVAKDEALKELHETAVKKDCARQAIRKNAAEIMEQRRSEAVEQQVKTDMRVAEFLSHKYDEFKHREAMNAKKEAKRLRVIEVAKSHEEEQRSQLLKKQEEHEMLYQSLTETRQVKSNLAKEETKQKQTDKRDFLERELAKALFQKFATIGNMNRKIDKIERGNQFQQDVIVQSKYYSELLARKRDTKMRELEEDNVRHQKMIFFTGLNNRPLTPMKEHVAEHKKNVSLLCEHGTPVKLDGEKVVAVPNAKRGLII